jgi:hypothetical protein
MLEHAALIDPLMRLTTSGSVPCATPIWERSAPMGLAGICTTKVLVRCCTGGAMVDGAAYIGVGRAAQSL